MLRAVYLADTMCEIRMLEGLASRLELTVIVPERLGADKVANFWPPRGVEIRTVRLPGGRAGFAANATAWLVRNRRSFDVVVVLDNLTAALAANVARRLGGPPVLLQVGRPTVEYVRVQRRPVKTALARGLVSLNERLADGIGAVSEYCATQCRAHNDTVWSVPWYGVDLELFRPAEDRDAVRAQLGLPNDLPIVMLRSRLAPEKDPGTFLDAMRLLRDRGRQVTVVYMGGERDEFQALAAAVGIEAVVGKPATVEELPLWYQAADVDVQSSFTEGLGLSPLESLACGSPVVVSDAGGLREVVDGGRVGGLVPVGDAAAMADAVARLLDDPALAADVAGAGRRHVAEHYSSDAAFDTWARLATEVARPHRWPRPIRVLFVDHETRLSGGQRDLVDLVRALPALDVDAHAALPDDGPLAEELRAHGVRVHIVPMAKSLRTVSRRELARNPLLTFARFGQLARSAAALAGLAERLRPDVVHSNSMKAHVVAWPAALRVGAGFVWHVRDVLPPGWLRQAIALLAAVAPHRVVCLSEAATETFASTPARRSVRIVPNGIRPRPFPAGAPTAFREGIGADDAPLVGIVGQIAWWKGQDVFVEAAARVAASIPRARFVIVGECLFPENEADFERAVRDRVEELGLEGRVAFTGAVDPIEPVMAALDVCVHASRLPEPFGRVIVESMAQGTPVVTTTIGAGKEIVTVDSGVLVPPDDPVALAAAVTDLLADALRRAAMGRAARARAGVFDIARTAAGVITVWDETRGPDEAHR